MSQDEIDRSLFGRRRRVQPEAAVLKAVWEWLNLQPGCRVWRRNVGSGRFRNPAGGRDYFVKFGEAGMADLYGLVDGVHLECEIKAFGKKPTPVQEAWLQFIREFGGIAFYCDSLDMCIDKFHAMRKAWQR